MKLFHTSDWHLGRMLYGRSLIEDQKYFLDSVFLPAVREEMPDFILLCGDIYDRQVAPGDAIELFDKALGEIAELGIPTVIISGNHDGAQRIAILKSILSKSGIHIATSLKDALSPLLLSKGGERIQIFPLPYFDASEAREFLGDDSLRGMNSCMEGIISRMVPLFEPDCLHILMAHCFVSGAQVSDSESTLFVGGSGNVSASLFKPFDYTALGHLHAPQKAGEKARYCGSPLKYSVDEENHRKGFLIAETEKSGDISFKEHPIPPLRDVVRISGKFSELMERGQKEKCLDYAELTLTDGEPVLLAAEQLRPYYPNMLSVRNPWASASGELRAEEFRTQDESTVFSSFLKNVCDWEPDEADMELFESILKEGGEK